MHKILKEARLIATVGLLLFPIALLGGLFVTQSSKDIAFAEREVRGLDYLKAVMPIHAALSKDEQNVSEAMLQKLAEAQSAHNALMNLTNESEQLIAALQGKASGTVAKLEQSSKLIAAIADKSNLILDPDIDTYYLMDVVVMRLPEIMRSTANLSAFSEADEGGRLKAILAAETIRSLFEASNASLIKATENTATGALSAELNATSKRSRELGLKTIQNLKTQFATGSNTGLIGNAEKNQLITASFENWTAAAADLDLLLNVRIATFKKQFFSAIGISAVVTLVALFLAVSVLRKLLARLDDRIVYLAHHDPMTQLKNRASFTAEMAIALAEADRSGEVLALHVIDCDNFKTINDSHGHPAGDAVLQHLANCLLKHTRQADLVGRLGGDEFVILQRNAVNPDSGNHLAKRIVEAMHQPVPFGSTAISARVTIGLALYPQHSHNALGLMARADAALYAAKAAGRNRALTYSRDLETEIAKRRDLENEVRDAVKDNRLFLHFQPQFDNAGIELRGFEALLRLKSRAGDTIPPNTFIPIAETMGLIDDYGRWVLERATETAAYWPEEIMLAVNLSPLQFKAGSISQTIRDALHKSGLRARRLQVEITEGILLEETAHLLAELNAIRAMGVSIAMDDFGTGFSSLSYLWRFRFDKIKIDRSFITALDGDRESAENILKTIVMLGHSLAMQVTAEGIETSQQADLMNRLNCDEIQGFFYGKPVPEQELASVILRSFQRKEGIFDEPIEIENNWLAV